MIYIVTLLAILVCVVVFDFGRMNNPRLKKICYASILIWLTALAGFSYNVGADIPGYMRQYAEIGRHHFETWKDLTYFENRQPGWMLLNILCNEISNRFVVLMVVIAVFANCIVFNYIKKHTRYVFLGILLYFVCSYLNWNFNSLRQTVAIAFFLLGYDYLVDKKWIKYYICCFGAFLFHSTAVICFLFPLLYLIKINTRILLVFLSAFIILTITAIRVLGDDFIKGVMLENAESFGLFADNAEQLTEAYFGDNAKEYGELNIFGIIAMLLYISPVFFVCVSAARNVISLPHITIILLLAYMFLYLMDFVIPVVFMRFLMYLDVVYFCALSEFVMEFPKKLIFPRNIVTICLLCVALYRPVQTLFAVNMSTDIPFYRQFYPYYSVFDPQIDPLRSANFGAYREK